MATIGGGGGGGGGVGGGGCFRGFRSRSSLSAELVNKFSFLFLVDIQSLKVSYQIMKALWC